MKIHGVPPRAPILDTDDGKERIVYEFRCGEGTFRYLPRISMEWVVLRVATNHEQH